VFLSLEAHSKLGWSDSLDSYLKGSWLGSNKLIWKKTSNNSNSYYKNSINNICNNRISCKCCNNSSQDKMIPTYKITTTQVHNIIEQVKMHNQQQTKTRISK
jgi:hypothetical protein